MRIAILGTRGIPNNYGGFEQYAEQLSVYLVKEKWDVTVYNTDNHPYKSSEFKGVKIAHKYNPETYLGSFGQFIYDFLCIIDIRKKKYDIVYQLGYTSSAIFNSLLPKQTLLVTNMDGLEWKRTKYNKYVQRFLMYSEKLVVKRSNHLIADSLGIQEYIKGKYKTDAFYSSYSATIPTEFPKISYDSLPLIRDKYNLLIARFVPENNIETILDAHAIDNHSTDLFVIGDTKNKFGTYLKEKFKRFANIHFIGSVYNKQDLNTIRQNADLYFHGHSVGGTNPSLLEAMACSCNIVAHNNIFNKSVLGIDALYFDNPEDIYQIIINRHKYEDFFFKAKNTNLEKIKSIFSEEYIFNTLKEKLIIWQNKNAL